MEEFELRDTLKKLKNVIGSIEIQKNKIIIGKTINTEKKPI